MSTEAVGQHHRRTVVTNAVFSTALIVFYIVLIGTGLFWKMDRLLQQLYPMAIGSNLAHWVHWWRGHR